MTRAPAAASASAVARPMPRDAPVTSAVLLARLAMMAFSMPVAVRDGIASGMKIVPQLPGKPRLCLLHPCF